MCISQGSIREAEPLGDSNQDLRGKGILGNVVQLSRVDALQSHCPLLRNCSEHKVPHL